MDTYNEWFYGELLKNFKEKENKKEEAAYKPIELEFPIEKIEDNNKEENSEEKRGIEIINF